MRAFRGRGGSRGWVGRGGGGGRGAGNSDNSYWSGSSSSTRGKYYSGSGGYDKETYHNSPSERSHYHSGGNMDRYSSRNSGRVEEYHRSSRGQSEASSGRYSNSRDEHVTSPEVPRKRIRMDSGGYNQGSSSHRSRGADTSGSGYASGGSGAGAEYGRYYHTGSNTRGKAYYEERKSYSGESSRGGYRDGGMDRGGVHRTARPYKRRGGVDLPSEKRMLDVSRNTLPPPPPPPAISRRGMRRGRGATRGSGYTPRGSPRGMDISRSHHHLPPSSPLTASERHHRHHSHHRRNDDEIETGTGPSPQQASLPPLHVSQRHADLKRRAMGVSLAARKRSQEEWTQEYWRRVRVDKAERAKRKRKAARDIEDNEDVGGDHEGEGELQIVEDVDPKAEADEDEDEDGPQRIIKLGEDYEEDDEKGEGEGKNVHHEEPDDDDDDGAKGGTDEIHGKSGDIAMEDAFEDDEKKEDGDEREDEDEEAEHFSKEKLKRTLAKGSRSMKVTIQHGDNGRAVNEGRRSSMEKAVPAPRKFIRLDCPHCHRHCTTFRDYAIHLYNQRHQSAMHKVALNLKSVLGRMRSKQRHQQRELEEMEEAQGTLGARSNFCYCCKLNFRQTREEHEASEMHQKIRKFMLPVCHVCQLAFKSPMIYERHLCSLEHLKRKKQYVPVKGKKKALREPPEVDQDVSEGEEEEELDLDNFITMDAVGDVDEGDIAEDGEGESHDDEEREEGKRVVEKQKKVVRKAATRTKDRPVGENFVKKVRVYYCELCHKYLAQSTPPERTLHAHLCSRPHQQHFRAHQAEQKRLEKEKAKKERIAALKAKKLSKKGTKTSEEKEGQEFRKSKSPDTTATPVSVSGKEDLKAQGKDDAEEELGAQVDAGDTEMLTDDKLWDDMDRDLGELLKEAAEGDTDVITEPTSAEAAAAAAADTEEATDLTNTTAASEPEGSTGTAEVDGVKDTSVSKEEDEEEEEEEEDSHTEGERWDRFKNSEKGSQRDGGLIAEDAEMAEPAEVEEDVEEEDDNEKATKLDGVDGEGPPPAEVQAS